MFRVLVIDDDPLIAAGTERLLQQAGYEASTAADGPSALDLLARSPQEARERASEILGLDIKGHVVERVMVTEGADIADEYYFSLLLDRANRSYLAMCSVEGGMDIETLAEEHPEKLARIEVDPIAGLDEAKAAEIVAAAGFAEAYGFARLADGNYVVSAYGYRGGRTGPAANNNVDAILFSLKPDGGLNRSWGTNGLVTYHFGEDGNGSGDRHRGHLVLPDGRIVGVGATQGTNNAILTVTAPDGSGGETATIDLGGTDDALWGITAVGDGYHVVATGVGDGDAKLVTIDLSPAKSALGLHLANASVAFGAEATGPKFMAKYSSLVIGRPNFRRW